MPTIDTIITEIITREGSPTNDPNDKGGRTQYGISETSNPEAWKDGKVTEAEARAIYYNKYVKVPGYDKVPSPIQSQLIDFGVLSGYLIATMKLQEILGAKQDGILGPKTLSMLASSDLRSINNKLVASRIKMTARIIVKDPTQLKFLLGWITRCLEFYI